MVVLGVPPGAGGDDLGHDLALVPLLVGLLGDLLRDLLLLLVVEVDAAAVVGPRVRALPVYRRRVVHPVEELEELAVRDPGRVVVDQQRLVVWSIPSAWVSRLRFTRIMGTWLAPAGKSVREREGELMKNDLRPVFPEHTCL